MKTNDLKSLTVEELRNKDSQLREDLFKLRFKHGIRRIENPAKLNQLRRDIARIQTVLAQIKHTQPA